MTAKPDSRQFVRVEFARALASIVPGKSRHPWHWCIIVQDGHIFAISSSFETMAEAFADFSEHGVVMVAEAEKRLAEMYCGPHETPYDVAGVTPNQAAG